MRKALSWLQSNLLSWLQHNLDARDVVTALGLGLIGGGLWLVFIPAALVVVGMLLLLLAVWPLLNSAPPREES